MSDPFMDFLLTRNREKVLAEARPAPLEVLYAEASQEIREVIDVMPIGVLRRKLLEAQETAVREAHRPVKVVGNRELLAALRKSNAERERLAGKVAELRAIVDGQGAA